MKQILTFVAIMLTMLLQAFSQVPHTFSYQAIVRDAESNVVAEKQVIVKVQILQGADDGVIVYTEIHNVKTNKNGLITFELGGGVSNDDFSSINWSNAPHFVKATTNVNGRLIMAVAPILAVPYALYAEKANVDFSDYAKANIWNPPT